MKLFFLKKQKIHSDSENNVKVQDNLVENQLSQNNIDQLNESNLEAADVDKKDDQKDTLLQKISYYNDAIIASYQNRIGFLLKNSTNHDHISQYINLGWIKQLKSEEGRIKWIINPRLAINEYQEIIKRLVGRDFLLFCHLTSSFEYLDLKNFEAFDKWQKKITEKKLVFAMIIKRFDDFLPNFFNWNIIHDLIEILMFKESDINEAVVSSMNRYMEINVSYLEEKMHLLLKEYEWNNNLIYSDEQRIVKAHWKKCLESWRNELSKILAWTPQCEWHFTKFFQFADLICNYRKTHVNFMIEKKLNIIVPWSGLS